MTSTLAPEVRDLLTLRLVPGLGPRLTAAILERFGSAAAALRATPEQLREVPHIGAKLADQIHRALPELDVDAELGLMEQHDVHLLVQRSPDYPAALATIGDAPQLLYIRGALTPADANAVALVGSRHCTSYGRRVAQRLAKDLARRGYTVVSGLARGIDAAAHRGALEAGGRTVAVLAGGLARIYPPEHAELASDVAGSGALLSEAAMRMEPLAVLFPGRNRLISGLSRAVIVVEAADRSGALITAREAGEQGRAVFAVPGPVDSPTSRGTHELIRKGAVLVRDAEDVLEELEGVRAGPAAAPPAGPPPGMDDRERRVWEFLAGEPRHMDEVARGLGLSVPEAAGTLMALEMKKAVRRLPGNRYERT